MKMDSLDSKVNIHFQKILNFVETDSCDSIAVTLLRLAYECRLTALRFSDSHRKSILHHVANKSAEMMKGVLHLIEEDERLELLSAQDGSETGGIDAYGGNTVLHYAVINKNHEVVKCILNSLSDEDDRAYLISIQNHIVDVDDIPPSSYGGETALHRADSESFAIILSSLSSSEERFRVLEITDANGNTPLHLCVHGDIEYLLEQLDEQSKLSLCAMKNDLGFSRLFEDLNYSRVKGVKAVVNSIAPTLREELFSLTDDRGKQALHLGNSIDICEYAIEVLMCSDMPVLLKTQDNNGNTVFHDLCASFSRCPEILKRWLEVIKSSDRLDALGIKNIYGFTAVHVASLSGRTEEMEVMLASLEHGQRLALLKVLVNPAEAGCVEVRNHHIQRFMPTNKENDRRYLDNNLETNQRISMARQNKIELVEGSLGDSALHYAVIKKDHQMQNCIINMLDSEDKDELLSLRDANGLTLSQLADHVKGIHQF